MTMKQRDSFGTPARGFSITLSLKEGYGEQGVVHSPAEVRQALEQFARAENVEVGGTLREEEIFYSYRSGDDMIYATEPGVMISGLFPPNKFGQVSDEELVEVVGKMVQYLADATGQTSVHAEVCGQHHAWKRVGQKTAREIAQEAK